MKIEKYNNDGWGISQDGFRKIIEIFDDTDFSLFKKYNIIEFGSGISTEFFVDYIDEKQLTNVHITSFENSERYTTKAKHSKLKLVLRGLITCGDNEYDEMFNLKQFNEFRIVPFDLEPYSRQKNCFYDIQKNDIPDSIDFVLLDGPSGNGRNIAFLHIMNKVHSGTIVYIDDYNHYDFLEKFNNIFKSEEIFRKTEINDRFVILKIL